MAQELIDIGFWDNGSRGAVVYSDGLVICIRKSGRWTMHDHPKAKELGLGVAFDGCRAIQLCHGDESDLHEITQSHAQAIRSLLESMRSFIPQ